MRKLWTGIKNNEVKFYDQDPTGNVDGISSVQEVNVLDDDFTDSDGNDIVTCLHETTEQQASSSPQQTA